MKDVEGLFIETSAKEGDNILEAVTELARSVTIRCSNQLSKTLNKKNKFDYGVKTLDIYFDFLPH